MDSTLDEKKGYSEGEQVTKVETSGYQSAHLTHHILKNEKELDTAAALANGVPLTPEERKYILRKIDWKLLPFMLTLYMMQFLDKTTLGLSVLLGVKTANNLTASQYNWLATVFYITYLFFELPQSLGLQRFPVAKFLSVNIMCWGAFLMLHAACSNFTGLLIVRALLGVCEGSVTSGFMIITSQYYTSVEQGQRVGMWFLMNGTAQIFSGLLSYGIHHIYSDAIQQWQILFILTGGLTFLLGVAYWFYFPDSPVNAKFLTPAERIMAIERIRENRTGIENKTWKKYQFIEALTDVKVWMFFLFSFVDNIPNALTNQNSTIYTQLGFTTLTSTLLGIPNGIIEIFTIGSGIYFLGKFPNSRSWIAMLYFIPNILGSILVLALPFENKYGLLGALYCTGFGTTGFVISLAWLQGTTSGHTKKTTAMFINLCGYCLGNICGPQLFQAQYAPRNTIPWIVIVACYSIAPMIVFAIRTLLIRRNTALDLAALKKREDGEDSEEELVDITHADGTTTVEKIDTRWRDLTDKENPDFRYVL